MSCAYPEFGKRISTRSGIILTPIRVIRPRDESQATLQFRSGSNLLRPCDCQDIPVYGLGENRAQEGEQFRTVLPVDFGAGFEHQPVPEWAWGLPMSFTDDGRGASIEDVLYWAVNPNLSPPSSVKWDKVIENIRLAEKFVLRIRWPESVQDWMYSISPDGSYRSVLVGVANAFNQYLKCDSIKHDWGEHAKSKWHSSHFQAWHIYLYSLIWVGRTGPENERMNVYEANIHLVYKEGDPFNWPAWYFSQ